MAFPSPWTLCALAVINFAGMFCCSITGFGENIIFQLGWYLMSLAHLSSGHLTESVAILTVIMWPSLATQATLQRRYANPSMALVLAVASGTSSALGVFLLLRNDNVQMKRALGALLVGLFLWRSLLEQRLGRERPPPKRISACTSRYFPALVLTGLCSGLLGGLFATPGPPSMVFVLLANVGKDEWRSTQAFVGLLQLPVRMAALLAGGPAERLLELWPHCFVSLASGLLGLVVGDAVAPRVSEQMFRVVVLFCLLDGGLTLLTAGLAPWLPAVGLVLAVVAVTALGSTSEQRFASARHASPLDLGQGVCEAQAPLSAAPS